MGNLLEANHGPLANEFPLLVQIFALAAWSALVGWLLYIAIEPFIRRVWPETIISWRRLLDGRFRDPLVGRDILIGSAVSLLTILARIGFHLTSDPPELIGGGDLVFVSGLKRWAYQMHSLLDSFLGALVITTAVVLVRILVRKDWLTGAVLTALMVVLLTLGSDGPATNAIFFAMIWGSVFLMAIRFGLLALVAGGALVAIDDFVRVWDPSTWYFPYVFVGLALALVLPLFGFFVSLGGKKLFKTELLDS